MQKSLLSIKEAAQVLGLHPQTIYRKIARGELPAMRFGRTIRLSLAALGPLAPPKERSLSKPPRRLPTFLKDLFWDLEMKDLRPSNELVIERILEYGNLGAISWLLDHIRAEEMSRFLLKKGAKRLTPKSYNFWCHYFQLDHANPNIHQSPKKTLGQTHWR